MSAPNHVQSLIKEMAFAVETAAESGRPLAVEWEAIKMVAIYPEAGMTVEEAQNALCRMAASRHVPIEFGDSQVKR